MSASFAELAQCMQRLRDAGATTAELSKLKEDWGRMSAQDITRLAEYLRQQPPHALANIVEDIRSDNRYELGPDSLPQAGVSEGNILEFMLSDSNVYSGICHQCWLYVPAQYDRQIPIPLMAFMDGGNFVLRDGQWRVPVVFDNLIAKKQLPTMAAVFIDPGSGASPTETKASDGSLYLDTSARSLEYDTLDDRYANFIVEEVFPKVREHVLLIDSPEGRGIAGHSSGGICAFTAAWQRPDQFRKVLSANGSFTNKRGGNVYPDLVQSSDRKPIRVWQQSGERDLVREGWGVWSEANKLMAAALEEKGYDHKFVFGQGSHSSAHAASLFPNAMRWLWRDCL